MSYPYEIAAKRASVTALFFRRETSPDTCLCVSRCLRPMSRVAAFFLVLTSSFIVLPLKLNAEIVIPQGVYSTIC